MSRYCFLLVAAVLLAGLGHAQAPEPKLTLITPNLNDEKPRSWIDSTGKYSVVANLRGLYDPQFCGSASFLDANPNEGRYLARFLTFGGG